MLRIFLTLLCVLGSSLVFAADSFPPGYDQSADLAELAQNDDEDMRHKLLRSRFTQANEIWQSFESALEGMSAADYLELKPLIVNKTISEIQGAVANGQLNYETLALFYIYRLREIESDSDRFINSVIALNPNVLTEARALDTQRQAGRDIDQQSLVGMPILLKDNIGFAGIPTTAGTVALANNNTRNAFVATALEERGALILGKANLSEWAYFFCDDCPSGYSAVGGQTLNPYGRKSFGTGGSSSGSGAATAASLAVAAVGSETSGSILSPSSANSLVGLKPTTGSLSRSGVVPISATLDTTGPMARSVADAVILFNGMTGFDDNDKAMPLLSSDIQLELREVPLTGKRLGILSAYEDNEFYVAAAELLANNGSTNIELEFQAPSFDGFLEFLGMEMVRDLAIYLSEYGADDVQLSSIEDVKHFNEQDLEIRAPYGQALVDMMSELEFSPEELEALRIELQDVAKGELDALFEDKELDVLVSVNNYNAGLAALANYPALTIPMGYEDNGRPVGLTFIATSFQEQLLVDVGLQFEKLSQARLGPADYQ